MRAQTIRRGEMLRPVRGRDAQMQRTEAPIGGWNTRDSVDNVPPLDALELDNWFPDLGEVRTRPGYSEHTDSDDIDGHTPGQVETLAEYNSGSTRKLLACDGGKIYDATTAGAPSDITGAATITLDRWQWANFDGKIGFVNGADTPLQWNGTGDVSTLTLSGSGLTAANVIGINVFKNRTWFWEDGSQDVWYSALNTLGGALTKFPLSRVGQFGGYLSSMITWTRDGGSGPDDFAVFLMTSGEAIVYQGSSPALAGDWALVGIYDIGEPLSIRAHAKFGGDVFIATHLDYVNLANVLAGAEARSVKSKVSGALKTALNSLWGWDAIVYPAGKMVIFNIPVTVGSEYQQHVMNTVTGAWCGFKGIVSNCWCLYDNRIFFGGPDGMVYEFDIGNDDDGTAIDSSLQTAWLPMGGYENKTFNAVREIYKVNADITVVNRFATDFNSFSSQQYPVAVDSAGTAWGDPWGSPWSANDGIYNEWHTIGSYGATLSMRKYLSTKQKVTYLGATWLYNVGQRL